MSSLGARSASAGTLTPAASRHKRVASACTQHLVRGRNQGECTAHSHTVYQTATSAISNRRQVCSKNPSSAFLAKPASMAFTIFANAIGTPHYPYECACCTPVAGRLLRVSCLIAISKRRPGRCLPAPMTTALQSPCSSVVATLRRIFLRVLRRSATHQQGGADQHDEHRRDHRPVAETGIRREALHGLHAVVQRVYRKLRRHRLQAAALVHLRGHAGVGGAQ